MIKIYMEIQNAGVCVIMACHCVFVGFVQGELYQITLYPFHEGIT